MRTTLVHLAAAATAGVLLLAGCSSSTGQEVPTAAASATSAPAVTEQPAPETEAPKDPSREVTIDGVTYTGTEEAPLKIGDDTPGQPPALEAGVPQENLMANGEKIADQKYVVAITGVHEGNTDKIIGWKWLLYYFNDHGSYKPVEAVGAKAPQLGFTDPFPTRDAAIDAPKTLNGRTLDRSEYVLVVFDS